MITFLEQILQFSIFSDWHAHIFKIVIAWILISCTCLYLFELIKQFARINHITLQLRFCLYYNEYIWTIFIIQYRLSHSFIVHLFNQPVYNQEISEVIGELFKEHFLQHIAL